MTQTSVVRGVHTCVSVEGDETRVIYRGTTVVRWSHDTIVLDTGGWKSVTTKTRMNQAANQFGLGFGVFQRDFEWFVGIGTPEDPHGNAKENIYPYDGRVFTIDRETRKPATLSVVIPLNS